MTYAATGYNFADWKTNSSQDANSISVDPEFTNPATHDFNLQATSDCIDTGTDVSLTTDYAGNVVPYNVTPDMGAYEYGY